jgi:hypothetical protein
MLSSHIVRGRAIARLASLVVLASIVGAFIGVAPAAAGNAVHFQERFTSAETSADPSCVANAPAPGFTCEAYILNVVSVSNDAHNPGDRVCYEHDHWNDATTDHPASAFDGGDEISYYEFNCNRTVGIASFQQPLASATLSPAVIHLHRFVCSNPYPDCDPADPAVDTDVTVAGTWTGVGPISNFHDHSVPDPQDAPCFVFVENGRERVAIPPALPFTPTSAQLNEGTINVRASDSPRCA